MARQQFLNEKTTNETTVLVLGYQILCHGKHRKSCKTCAEATKTDENRAKINSCVKRGAVIYSIFPKIRLRIQELSLSHDAISCVLSNIESQEIL